MKTYLLADKAVGFCLAFLLLSFASVRAQTDNGAWESLLEQLYTIDDVEGDTWEQTFDGLAELAEHPMNINTTTREELEQLPFLSAQQVEDLCYWLYRYGPMRSLGELAMIESLDPLRRQLLQCFVYVGEPATEQTRFDFQELLKRGHHDLLLTAKVPFYKREGDRNGYLGYPYRHTLRYQFSSGQQLKMGLVGAQDAGEPFFAGRNKAGYDFYSFYLLARDMGRLKTLAVGRYRLSMGMGLVVNNDFLLGKLATLQSLGRNHQRIRAHSSRSESNYLQGAAATVALSKSLDLSLFASYRRIDATLNNSDSTVATILESGYHRTPSEMDKKNNTGQAMGGGNLNWRQGGFHAGVTAVGIAMSRELRPDNGALYRRYRAHGKEFFNASVDYGYNSYRLNASGETAIGGKDNALATINTLSYRLTDQLDVLGVQRFYSYRYYALLARSFSEGGSVQNESGLYAGLNWRPSVRLALQAYADYAHFAWARYGVSFPSDSWDYLLAGSYTQGPWTFAARYRLRQKQRDNEEKSALETRWEQRARLSANYQAKQWNAKTQVDFAHVGNEQGWMVSQNVGGQWGKRWRMNALVAWFKTDGYDTRIYTYERGMLYAYSFPSFSGHGMRLAFLGRADISTRLMLMAKLSTTHYFDRDVIGTGYQQIDSPTMTDLEIQLKWKF